MQRIPEPELMDDVVQAAAYAQADFEDAHARFIELFRAAFPDEAPAGNVLDLGCGPAASQCVLRARFRSAWCTASMARRRCSTTAGNASSGSS